MVIDSCSARDNRCRRGWFNLMTFQENVVSMIISTPVLMFTELLTSERGHDQNVHTFLPNSMILVGGLR
jgi:hypothetical protein